MTAPPPFTVAPFTMAHAAASHWGGAAKACLDGVAAAAGGANLGILYATEAFAEDLPSVLTFLRETTRIPHWIGAAAPGICAGDTEYRDGGALAVMVGRLPEGAFACFSGPVDESGGITWPQGEWGTAIVHGDPRNALVRPLVADLAGRAAIVAGGLVSSTDQPTQIAGTLVGGALSGLLLRPEVAVVTGLSQGCSPIGPEHVVTEAWHGVVMQLDGRAALDVLKEEAGELVARDLRRAAGYIHVALSEAGAGDHDYLVRSLVGIDQRQGWLAVGERIEVGQRLMLVRRDANGARADLRRMLDGVTRALDGRTPLAALYFTCVARGVHMFGDEGAEMELVEDALDGAPLMGFFANGEIAGGMLYGYTGVLAVIVGGRP